MTTTTKTTNRWAEVTSDKKYYHIPPVSLTQNEAIAIIGDFLDTSPESYTIWHEDNKNIRTNYRYQIKISKIQDGALTRNERKFLDGWCAGWLSCCRNRMQK